VPNGDLFPPPCDEPFADSYYEDSEDDADYLPFGAAAAAGALAHDLAEATKSISKQLTELRAQMESIKGEEGIESIRRKIDMLQESQAHREKAATGLRAASDADAEAASANGEMVHVPMREEMAEPPPRKEMADAAQSKERSEVQLREAMADAPPSNDVAFLPRRKEPAEPPAMPSRPSRAATQRVARTGGCWLLGWRVAWGSVAVLLLVLVMEPARQLLHDSGILEGSRLAGLLAESDAPWYDAEVPDL
jgi:hypothetical protein